LRCAIGGPETGPLIGRAFTEIKENIDLGLAPSI
jgi:hypothetical protein